jgi:hypothetical protein
VDQLTLDPSYPRNQSLKPVSGSEVLSAIHAVPPGAVVLADFVAFYVQHTGGAFVECVLPESPLGPVVVAQFLAIDAQDSYSLERALAYLQAEGDARLLPFAEDPSGSLFAVNTASDDGAVYFWDHETRVSTKVSLSFTDFVNGLRPDI